MKKQLIIILASLALLAAARADTVTVGATVTLDGTFFTGNGSWPLGTNAAPADLVSGVCQPDGQQWNFNSVWWNGAEHPGNSIRIDLNGSYLITDFTIQSDDNDRYKVEYHGGDALWYLAWNFNPPGGWGLQTSSYFVSSPFITDAFRLTASTAADHWFAVSQFEANGQRVAAGVPDGGATIALFGAVFGLLGVARRVARA